MKFVTLDVWKRSLKLSVEIFKYFEEVKDFGFRSQITRAGLSVPCNIAEGIERNTVKDTVHFLRIAKSSGAELFTQIHIGLQIGYIEKQTAECWCNEIDEICAMLVGLTRRIEAPKSTVN